MSKRSKVHPTYKTKFRAENTFYRYKKRFGGRLSARNEEAQRNEVLTACNILNRMTELGMPNSIALRG